MDFIDEVKFRVRGGRGGDGCVSFRREKYVPKGGPDGGDGGNGGSVVLHVNPNLSTLFDLRHRKQYSAGNGKKGSSKCKHGKMGETIIIQVPPGTVVKDADSNTVLADLTESEQEHVVAQGGKGGKGNSRFATPTRQAPDFAEKGTEGESRYIQLELKLLANVGLVGLPNAGKSTLLSHISSAKPKIADYPFTTLVPNLGIVYYNDFKSFVAADIPGLIEGSHAGRGLGDQFLRHMERTSILIFLIESNSEDIFSVYNTLLEELKLFDASLLDKPRVLTLSKIDLISKDKRHWLPSSINGQYCYYISAVTGEGIRSLLDVVAGMISEVKHE